MLKKAGMVCAVWLLLTSLGLAQENRFDIFLGAASAFSKQSSGNGATLTPTTNLGIITSARIRINAYNALAFNYGHVLNSQKYSAPPFDFRIHNTVGEYTFAYVLTPMETKKFEPFLTVGIGWLRFNPDSNSLVNGIQAFIGQQTQSRTTYLYGGGLDYKVLSRLAVRFQYRGLVYTAPDFKVSGLFTGSKGHLAEPSVGIVFKF